MCIRDRDDEERIRQMIKKYANFEGHEVVEAADGMEAVKLCKEQEFDIVVMDVRMPEVDGFSAVSYTHLDVYKRQWLRCARESITRSLLSNGKRSLKQHANANINKRRVAQKDDESGQCCPLFHLYGKKAERKLPVFSRPFYVRCYFRRFWMD